MIASWLWILLLACCLRRKRTTKPCTEDPFHSPVFRSFSLFRSSLHEDLLGVFYSPKAPCLCHKRYLQAVLCAVLEHREFWTNCFAPLPISVALLLIPSRANKILFRACRFSSFGLEALSLHAQQSLSPSQSQPQQDNPHDSSSGAAWSSLAHRIPGGLMSSCCLMFKWRLWKNIL